MSSPRKPYQRLGSSRLEFFSKPARHLMESGSSESVFEKPYRDPEYGDMHQSPNTPSVSPGGGLGEGFNCYYSDQVCGEGIECFIGTNIPATGGPWEAQAGFREPVAQEGEITGYTIDGANGRHIQINVDPGKVTHSILIEYVDSYGTSHSKAITLDCDFLRDLWQRMDLWGLGDLWGPARASILGWVSYFDNSRWVPWGDTTWVGSKWNSYPLSGSNAIYLFVDSAKTWTDGYRPTKCRITHDGGSLSAVGITSNDIAAGSDITDFTIIDNSNQGTITVTNIEFYDGGWESYFDNTKWSINGYGTWTGSTWTSTAGPATAVDEEIRLSPIGTWAAGYRPEFIRVTFTPSPINTNGAGTTAIRLYSDVNSVRSNWDDVPYASGTSKFISWGQGVIGAEIPYVSGTEIDLADYSNGDIYGLVAAGAASFNITNIEFLE